MKIEIKKAKMNELREIVKIILTEFSKPPFNEKVNFNSAMDSLKFYFRLGEVYIAVINKKIVGMIAFK
ncbi:MAG: hypothetical protein KKA64_02190, partial [Nanoarchaeota archaeon]|nr:hypothetical protein [Nanoarchaeota archaeon]